IATYSTAVGLNIHKPYQGRMSVTSLVLNETSITFWDIRMDDSGCYMCLFNVFPLGSFSGRTCLSVLTVVTGCPICVLEGLSASVHYNTSKGHLIAVCNAVGLPEPTITWNNLFNSTPTQKMVRHTNGMVSITSKLEIYNTQSIVEVLKLITICLSATINQTFQFILLPVLAQLTCVLCLSFFVIFAKTHMHCCNGQGGIVFSGKQQGDQLKIFILVLWGNLKYMSVTSPNFLQTFCSA
uniref:Ig-like domain-containing protein n=1 Tax=Athene cunicularia TaxID=194338 RepID=A0A663NCW4_ATHCN